MVIAGGISLIIFALYAWVVGDTEEKIFVHKPTNQTHTIVGRDPLAGVYRGIYIFLAVVCLSVMSGVDGAGPLLIFLWAAAVVVFLISALSDDAYGRQVTREGEAWVAEREASHRQHLARLAAQRREEQEQERRRLEEEQARKRANDPKLVQQDAESALQALIAQKMTEG